ncbi:MAG TPA: hypothetical protein VGZ47_06630 [Gemmataceae bacterium]|jgi:hypothetical protein|nr:hypothetical protein [Gemmataceae bacterium]
MQVICCNLAALAIAGIFYAWRDYHQKHCQRIQQLRERVAFMLWTAANQVA